MSNIPNWMIINECVSFYCHKPKEPDTANHIGALYSRENSGHRGEEERRESFPLDKGFY